MVARHTMGTLRRRFGAAVLALLPAVASAVPTALDWDTLTWLPEGNTNLSETYPIGNGSVTVTYGGNTAFLDQAGAVIAPSITTTEANTGGLNPVEASLYVATDYPDSNNPEVTVTLDFSGYPGGISNISFIVFDVDQGNGFLDTVTATALTPSGPVNPTQIITSPSNTQINANSAQGTSGSPGTSSDGNVTFVFGDAGTPVTGITQVTFIYRNDVGTADPAFQWINIHDFSFDDPTADISLSKSVDPAAAAPGQNVTFTIDLANAGPDSADGVEVTDLLPAGYDYVSDTGGGSYDAPSGIWMAGDIAAAGSAQLQVTATVLHGGPWNNVAEVTTLLATDSDSTPGNNVPAEDDQDNAEALVPVIGAAKAVVAGPTNNGDGSYTLTYRVTLENLGNDTINGVQVVDELGVTFAAAAGYTVDAVTSADLTVNTGFDGTTDTNVLAGTDSLSAGSSATVDFVVTITPGATPGPYDNFATGSGTSPGGVATSDISVAGLDPDPDGDGDPGNNTGPTPVSFSESPQIGIAKAVVTGPTSNGDGSHTLTYRFTLENFGDVVLSAVQVVENFDSTFAAASGYTVDAVTSSDFSPNGSFDGSGDTNVLSGTDTLAVAATGSVDVTVTVIPGGNLGPYDNSAFARGTSPAGATTLDTSVAGVDPDANNDGDPVNDVGPTPVSFTEAPQIGAAKSVSGGPTNNGDGTFTLSYTVLVENSGDVGLDGVQVSDDLSATFATAGGFTVDAVVSGDFTVNGGYDGSTDTDLLSGTDTLASGASGTVSMTVTVTPGGNLGPYDNSATASGSSAAGTGVSDLSTSGADPDPDGDGDPGNNATPTPVSFAEMPQIGAAKAVSAPVNNGDGSFTLSYTIVVENSGDVSIDNLQVSDDLASTFAAASGFSVDSLTSSDFTVNAGFDGAASTNLLAGTDSLAAAGSGAITLTVTVTPGSNSGPYENTAVASGTTPAGTPVSDLSTAGNDPDPGNDGPSNDLTPTPVSFGLGVDATVDITDFSVPGDDLVVTVTDADLDTDPGVIDTVVVTVINDTTGEVETLTLSETAPDSGIFTATIPTVFGTSAGTDNDGVFNTEIGHTVTVSYTDAVTSSGGSAVLTDTGIVGNTPPTAVDDSSSTPIDTAVAIPVLANDSDPNGHTLSIDSVTQPANGSVTFTADGTVIYTPDTGFTGVDTFTYTISDGNGGFATATVTVNVDNNTPTAVSDSSVTPVDTPVTIDVLNNDSDPNNDPLEVVPGSVTDPANGTAVLNPDGTITYTPDPGFIGTDTFTYTITDPDGNTDSALVTVVVSNDTPQAVDDAVSTPLDTPVSIDVLANDSDPNNDPLEITGFTQPANGSVTLDDNGTPGDPSDDRMVYTPDPGFTGNDTFTYTISDPAGNTDIATVVVDVQATSTIEGNAWLDADIDDQFDANEQPLQGWLIDVLRGGNLVATVAVSADGSYSVTGLSPGSGYRLQLRHPSSAAVFGVIDNIDLPPGTTVIDQNLPIDPSGVVYDANTRQPVAGATVTLSGPGGALPAACLLPGQQDQVTGSDGFYRFDVLADNDPACPSDASYTLSVTAPAAFLSSPSATIPPAATPLDPTGLANPFAVVPQPAAPQGTDSTLYYLDFVLAAGDPNVINNHIPLDPVTAAVNLRVTKLADRRTAVAGQLVLYEITVQNSTVANVSGLTLSDLTPAGFSYVDGSATLLPSGSLTVSSGRPLLFTGIDVAARSSVRIRYALRVTPGVVRGTYTNTVTPLLGNTPAGNTSSASVAVVADPDFEQTTVIGTVYGDTNGNGIQDPGEQGIPGVRLATVEGLLVETDAYGRYHLAGIDGGLRERGRNFIIKVDPATLPDGAGFTTENPRVIRITEGLMSQVNFGVRLAATGAGTDACCQPVEVKIAEVFFRDGSAEVAPEFMPLISELAGRLRASGGGTLYIQGHADASEAAPAAARDYTLTPRFATRSAQLSEQDKRQLDEIIAHWRGARNVLVEAVGHTDNIGIAPQNRGEFADNYALSRARAQAVATYVRLGLGIAPEQVQVAGRGPDQPVASNATANGRATNRRVELSIRGDWDEANAGELARQRARNVYEILRQLLGEDFMREVIITTEVNDVPQPTASRSSLWRQTAVALLGLVASDAHAASQCTLDDCRTESGYVVEIIEPDPQRAPSPNDTRIALSDNKRVDLSGRFMVPVIGGGRLWATEDPTAGEPRLAVYAPEVAAAEDGSLHQPIAFFVYSNYADFISRAELQIFHGGDIDLIEPLAVLPFDPGVFTHVEWNGAGLSRALRPGDELYYRVRVYDDKGRYDETHLSHLTLLTPKQYGEVVRRDPEKAGLPREQASRASHGPLDGAVLALKPGDVSSREREVYELTPRFDTRKAVLKAEDREALDRIIDAWKDRAGDVRIHVVGHTDSRPIAPQNRHEFADNQALSEARARSVVEYLGRGLDLSRSQIVSEGRAAREPVASNATEAGRAQNRRVEVNISGLVSRPADTGPAKAALVEPASNTIINVGQTLEEANNLMDARRGMILPGARRYPSPNAVMPSDYVLSCIYGQNELRVQRIPVNGSRVRIHGDGVSGGGLRINGEPVPLADAGNYVVEYMVPVGQHEFDIEVLDGEGFARQREKLAVEASGQQVFLVALADLTVSDNAISGSIEPLAADDRYQDDLLVEGRLAFYLKGKIRGKYLVTAQMDSREEELGDLFSNLTRKDPQSVLRRLDPDRYYPVYGDDSTTVHDTDSQGRFYVRAEWDRSSATWGNYHTGFTGNEFAQYNRSLYGARYQHESLKVTGKGNPRNEATLFVSEAQSAFGHSEFLGTGGSLYYLRHQDILPGSDKAWIELRDRDTSRVREVVTLTRGVDYEIDEIQGRLILAQPLMQITRLNAPGLIKDAPLDGNRVILLVDYEYLPVGFEPDKVIAGGRGRHWLTDDIAVGATYVDENRGAEDYALMGADLLYQPGEKTFVKLEYARTEATQSSRFFSDDGGLTFKQLTPLGRPVNPPLIPAPVPGPIIGPPMARVNDRDGVAWGVEARLNSRETFNTAREWVGSVFYRETEAGFSVARRDYGFDITEYGIELAGSVNDKTGVALRASTLERGGFTPSDDQRLSLQVDYQLTPASELSGEVRAVDELSTEATGTLAALRYSYQVSPVAEVYAVGQFTLDNDDGLYDNNDMGTIGASIQVGDRTAITGEYSKGHRGEGALLRLDHQLNECHRVYGTFTQSVDRSDFRVPGTQAALGHRSCITDQASLYNERQFVEDRGFAGIAHTFGVDFDPGAGWTLGLAVQQGELTSELGSVDRDSASGTVQYRGERLNYRGKVEYRNENGISDLRQKLTTNRMDLKLSENWRLLVRLNHAETEDQTLSDRDDSAVFTEGGVGFAFRPIDGGRLNLLAKYTFLYDLPAPLQDNFGTDQRSHVFAVEGLYRLTPRWELGGKLAQRNGELRIDRDRGRWFESTTNFFALRGRYHIIRRWDAMLEYRMLDADQADSTRSGWLIAADRHFNDHLRLGIGYNFTDFSDDLTDFGYDHKGWFINAIGKY